MLKFLYSIQIQRALNYLWDSVLKKKWMQKNSCLSKMEKLQS